MQDDITARRKQIEHVLKNNDSFFRYLVGYANAVPWEAGLNSSRFTYVGPKLVDLLGYPVEDMYRENSRERYIHPKDRARVNHSLQMAGKQGEDCEIEYRMITSDGWSIWIRDSVHVIKGSAGSITLQGCMFDITPYKLAIEAHTQSKLEFEAMFNSIPDAVMFTDINRRIVMNNPAALDMFGYSNEELIGQSTEMLYADKQDFLNQGNKRYRTDENIVSAPYEVRYRRKDGLVFWTETLGTQVRDVSGDVIGFIGMFRDVTERRQTEEKVRVSEQELSAILNSLQDAYFRVDSDGKFIRLSPSVEKVLGYTPDQLSGTMLTDLYVNPQGWNAFQQELEKQGGVIENHEAQLQHKDGTVIWVSVNAHYIWNEQGQPACIEGTARDISQLKAAEDLNSRFGRILDNSSNEIYVFDADTQYFIQVNRGALKNLGYSMKEMKKLTPLDLKPDFTREDFDEVLQPLLRGETKQAVFQTRHQRKDGSLYPVEVNMQLSQQETPRVIVAIIQDISLRIENEQQLQYLAHYDALTNLPNRVLFTDRLDQSLSRASLHGSSVALLFLDLDRFKIINDTLGHNVGDQALQALSERLRASVREGDTVARLGGDEFAIVLEDIASPDDVAPSARKILDILSQPIQLNEYEFIITTSIGISLFPLDGEDTQTLLKNADIAMYRAKDEGRNTYQFYSADMSAKAFERLNLETSLRHALEREEFVLYYQPQQNLSDGKVFGVEALIRWQHPDLGLISPLEFIPLLEETGLIIPVGEWVLRTACFQAQEWNENSNKSLRMSVNLSGRQITSSNFIATVEQALEDSKLDPNLLELEMTESILMQDMQSTIRTLEIISSKSVRLAIDDFGTGYSSLSYLKRFPIDTLKIDRSFIRDLTQDPEDATLVEAIIAMGRTLHLNVVAEGVETEQQLKFLQMHDCSSIQGYLISKPLPAAELTSLLYE